MLAAPLACNVFVSIGRCESDGDCPSGSTCDPQGKFCLKKPVDGGPDVQPDVDGGVDAPPDVFVPPCNTGAPFGPPGLVRGLEGLTISSARLTESENSVVFSQQVDGGDPDIYVAERADPSSPFVAPTQLPGVNLPVTSEYWPTFSSDKKLVFFESDRDLDGGAVLDQARIWQGTRSTVLGEHFGNIRVQTVFENPDGGGEGAPYMHPGGQALYFMSLARGGAGDLDLFVVPIFDEVGTAGTPQNLGSDPGGVNTAHAELAPVVSYDELTIFFAREDDLTHPSIWVATRSAKSAKFGNATEVAELKGGTFTWPTWLSNDSCRLYFVSDRATPTGPAGTLHFWVASRPKN
jgi:Tol biopolymer transport system component